RHGARAAHALQRSRLSGTPAGGGHPRDAYVLEPRRTLCLRRLGPEPRIPADPRGGADLSREGRGGGREPEIRSLLPRGTLDPTPIGGRPSPVFRAFAVFQILFVLLVAAVGALHPEPMVARRPFGRGPALRPRGGRDRPSDERGRAGPHRARAGRAAPAG